MSAAYIVSTKGRGKVVAIESVPLSRAGVEFDCEFTAEAWRRIDALAVGEALRLKGADTEGRITVRRVA